MPELPNISRTWVIFPPKLHEAAGLDNMHMKTLAIRSMASDCQDLLAQLQRVLARSKTERSQFKF